VAARNLTTRFVESIKTDRQQIEIPDEKVRGLSLRVTAKGTKSWAFRYTRKSDGRLRRVTLGQFPAMGLENARTRAKEETTAVAHGADPAGAVAARREAETFAEVSEDWLERHAVPNKRRRAVADDRSMLARHILPEIGSMKAIEITKKDVLRMLDAVAAKPDARLGESGQRKASRKLTHRPNRVFELTRAIFRWAVGRDILAVDPTFGLKPPIKEEKERERDLSPAEIKQLWTALERAPATRRYGKDVERGRKIVAEGDIPFTRPTALAMMLSLVTAQRIGEVAGIARSELELSDTAPVWTIPAERSKNRKSSRVPLSPLAIQLIREAMQLGGESDWLSPATKRAGLVDPKAPTKPINPHAPTKALERARTAIGLEDFRIHDLRRTAATRMAEMGISPHTISLVLNHVSARKGTITGKYVQYNYDREKREALEAWGARLERIVAGKDGANIVMLPDHESRWRNA
jgi:integrase